MEKWEIAKDWCLQRVGSPYVFGATGKMCTPAYRQARANQYPEYAEKIKKNCPRMSGKATECKGCRWCDPETGKGKNAYDCAQLTRWCMNAIGVSLVSGANSQWKQTNWEEKGSIDSLPRDKLCLLYREDADGKKHHTGVYLGDGWIVHAKGHDYGVVKEKLGSPRFTHWGIPEGLYSEIKHTNGGTQMSNQPVLRRGSSGDAVKDLQARLLALGADLGAFGEKGDGIDGKFGAATERAVRAFQAAHGLAVDGVVGPKTWAALEKEQTPSGFATRPDTSGQEEGASAAEGRGDANPEQGAHPPDEQEAAPRRFTVVIPDVDAATATYLLESYPGARAEETKEE